MFNSRYKLLVLFMTCFLFFGMKSNVVEYINEIVILSEQEYVLYELIMEYREEYGLDEIPLSCKLTYVAQKHCYDLATNKPHQREGCSLHSWSATPRWLGCCHGLDGGNPNCIWDKPLELSNYPSPGYEIAASGLSKRGDVSKIYVGSALDGWARSPAHNSVMLNLSPFDNIEWNAIGVGILDGFACVWFGEESDDCEPVIPQ